MLIPYISNGSFDWFLFKEYTEALITELVSQKVNISDSGSCGGYLSVFIPDPENTPQMICMVACGEFPQEKAASYTYFSLEKAVRLNKNLHSGHTLSRQSESQKINEFPGAVYISDDYRIFSFSGLKAVLDEAISVMVSCLNHFLHDEECFDNKSFIRLFEERIEEIPLEDGIKTIIVNFLNRIDLKK